MDKRKLINSLIVLVFMLQLLPTASSIPTGQGQQLFFDNFSTSQFSPNWNPVVLGINGNTASVSGNLTQTGGWLTMTVPRTLINSSPGCGGVCFGINSIMATSHSPIISSQLVTTPAIVPSLDGNSQSQSYSNFNTPQTFTIANAISGNTMILFITVIIGIGFSAPSVSSVVGTHDGGWTQRKSVSDNSGSNLAYEYWAIPNFSSDSVTITLSGACNANGCTMTGAEFEIKNASSLDSSGPVTNSGSGTSSSTTVSFGLAALVFAFTEQLSATTISYGVGLNGLYNFGGQAEEYDNGHSSSGNTAMAFTYSPSASWRNIGDAIDGTNSFSSSTNSGTGFIYSSWRLVPFNLTQLGNSPSSNNSHRDASTVIGLFNSTVFSGIGIEMSEVDNINDGQFLAPGLQRETIALTINKPQNGVTSNCYATYMGFLGPISPFITGCTSAHNAFVYSNPNSVIDLNTPHVFTLEMNLKTDGTSWVAMQVDQNSWYNVTQAACTCIESNSETYSSLYPLMMNGYSANNIGINPPTPNQSLGTLVNYVLIDNYVPSTLPPSPAPPLNPANNPLNIPVTNNPLFNPFGSIDPSGLWQYYANTIGNGVPLNTGNFLISPFYFGGAVLYVITVLTILGVLYFTPSELTGGRLTDPFMLGMIIFFDTVANFLMGTLAWWIFLSMAVFMMAIMVGSVPSKIGGSPGVPT